MFFILSKILSFLIKPTFWVIILPIARTFELWEELIHEIVGFYVYKITWKN